jgi:hypothetical protein
MLAEPAEDAELGGVDVWVVNSMTYSSYTGERGTNDKDTDARGCKRRGGSQSPHYSSSSFVFEPRRGASP